MLKYEKIISFRMLEEDYQKIKQEAIIRGLPLSILIRIILEDYLRNQQAIKYIDNKLKLRVMRYYMDHKNEIRKLEKESNEEKSDVDKKGESE